MKISKWVDMGQDVDVEVGVEDIRAALSEVFANVTDDRLGERGPGPHDVTGALNSMSQFLNALTDEHIGLLTAGQRSIVESFLKRAAERFKLRVNEADNSAKSGQYVDK